MRGSSEDSSSAQARAVSSRRRSCQGRDWRRCWIDVPPLRLSERMRLRLIADVASELFGRDELKRAARAVLSLGTPAAQERDTFDRGNTEGTPARARASTRGHSFLGESSRFLLFRARRAPRVPALSASELNGKEGVDGSSPSESSKIPARRGFLLPALVQPTTSLTRRASMIADAWSALGHRSAPRSTSSVDVLNC
jgi:hypothetical protein